MPTRSCLWLLRGGGGGGPHFVGRTPLLSPERMTPRKKNREIDFRELPFPAAHKHALLFGVAFPATNKYDKNIPASDSSLLPTPPPHAPPSS